MMYIGMDVHSSSCTFCVTNEQGVELDYATIETNGRLLINYVRGIEGRKKLTFEECEMSGWLCQLLKDEVEELVVCNPVANREYKRNKTDKLDARRLAGLLRGGFLTPVFHDGSPRERLRSLVSSYQDLVQEAVRLKNRYKALFRRSGKPVKGQAVYTDESFLEGLEKSDFKFIGESTYRVLARLEAERELYVQEIIRVGRQFKEIRCLKSLPGIKDLRAALIVSQVVDPHRFENKYKYFSYCGLVRYKKESNGKDYGSTRIWGNRILKCVYKMAAQDILRGNSGLRKYYDRLCSKGIGDSAAKNAVARQVAAISLSLWRNNTKYDDRIYS